MWALQTLWFPWLVVHVFFWCSLYRSSLAELFSLRSSLGVEISSPGEVSIGSVMCALVWTHRVSPAIWASLQSWTSEVMTQRHKGLRTIPCLQPQCEMLYCSHCIYSGTALLRTLWDLTFSPYYRGHLMTCIHSTCTRSYSDHVFTCAYSATSIQRPSREPRKCGLCRQVVFM